jgi:putative ABC transport system permease protein
MSVTSLEGNPADFHRRALEKVTALPGVRGAAFAWGVPLTGNNWPGVVDIEGQPPPSKESERTPMPLRSITTGYFELLGQAIKEGRDFRLTDGRDAPRVAIVNQAFVDRYFPGGNAIGKKIWMGRRDEPANEITGVVNNARTDDLTRPAEPELYLSFWQQSAFSKHLVVRTTAEPKALAVAIQRELRAVSPVVAVENLKTLDDIRSDSLAPRTFAMQLLVGFSIVGGVLTLVGIYGVLSLSVASRRRELAIRSAVGAQQSDIRNLVFGEGFRLIAGGLIAGAAAAVALSRVLSSFLYGVEPSDPITLAAVGVLFTTVALLACWVPTRRATKVDPLEALRYE